MGVRGGASFPPKAAGDRMDVCIHDRGAGTEPGRAKFRLSTNQLINL